MISPSEFQSAVKGKHSDIGQPKTNCSSALSPFMPEHEFSELLWENGHVVLQGQSNRPKSSSFPAPFPSLSGKTWEKEAKDAVIPKVGRHQAAGSVRNDFQTTGASGQIGLNGQDDELVPWLNYPIDDYYSEFFSEFSGANMNYVSSVVPTDGVSSFGQAARDAHGLGNGDGNRDLAGSSKSSKMRNSQLLKLQQQCLSFSPSNRLKEVDLSIGTACQGPSGDLSPAIVLKQELTASRQVQPNSGTPLMNFSHFSKPAALAKANLQSVDRVRGGEKASNAASGNLMESPLVESTGGLRSLSVFHRQLTSVTVKADLNPPVQFSQEMAFVENSDTICRKDAAKNSRNSNRTDTSNNQKSPDLMEYQNPDVKATEKCETAKCHERVIASSSMCSVNGTGVESNDVKNTVKRKFKEAEESEYPSERDHEDDSTGIRKPITGQTSSKKRSRAAEVHNLSERRRRDRINEKMRALQELIPNCNKVDKASMLDEAIEYLKTLQMQVQIMSMGSGLYIPQMMLSTGIQHMHAPHLGSFSPMGVGMGICTGLGFGMGMLDMAGSPLVPIPRMHGSQYPHAPIPVTAGPHGMVGSTNPQVFGIPGQSLPMSMPHPPPFIHLTGVSANVDLVPEAPAAEVSPVQTPGSGPPNLEDQQLNILEQIAKTSAGNTKAESSGQANKECFELQPVVQIDNQPLDVGCCEAVNSGNCIHLPP